MASRPETSSYVGLRGERCFVTSVVGTALTDEEAEALAEQDFPRSGEKLRGWPAWVQSVEYPSCPECGRRMELLLQIDSEQNLPYMFGDAGIGHITQCPEHRDQLAFGWACG